MTDNLLAREIAIFAERYGITDPVVAAALPVTFRIAARKVEMPVRQMVATATYENPKLANYLILVSKDCASRIV